MSLVNRLSKRVTIWKSSEATNKYNETVNEPVKVAEVWAAIEPLQGKEYFSAYAEQVDVSTRIRIRHREDIDRTMSVEYKGTTFEILSIINPKFGQKELQLMCKERQ